MYVAVKGGERAIAAAHRLLARRRRGDERLAEIEAEQIESQLALGVARVMAEASLYAPALAARALKQARGDTIEAVFLLRAYRTTLPRFGNAQPVDTAAMQIERRISATYKDLPGGQLLGPTFDYTHRLLGDAAADAATACGDERPNGAARDGTVSSDTAPGDGTSADALPGDGTSGGGATCKSGNPPRVADLLGGEGLIETDAPPLADAAPGDITREPLDYPSTRDRRLQALARGDEGWLLSLAYSTQRGYGRTHPFAGEIRMGEVAIELDVPELGLVADIGSVRVTECQMVNQFAGSASEAPRFTRGYGLAFGHAERKAMAMAMLDRSLRAAELGEDITAPAQDEEFVLAHADNVQASGFVEHLKLPHYVDFQAELDLVRTLRREHERRARGGTDHDRTDHDKGHATKDGTTDGTEPRADRGAAEAPA